MTGKRLIKLISLVFAIWYLLCIVGFDIHTCGHSGRSFVSSLMLHATAVNAGEDVVCHHAGCCKDEDCTCEGHEGITSRCSDDYYTLSAPAISRYDDEQHYLQPGCFCLHCTSPAEVVLPFPVYSTPDTVSAFPEEALFRRPDLGDTQSVLAIWRI